MGGCCSRTRQIGDDYYQNRTDHDYLLGRSLRGDAGAALQLSTVPVPLLRGINFATSPEEDESDGPIGTGKVQNRLAIGDEDDSD
jgi:hypothetical protein